LVVVSRLKKVIIVAAGVVSALYLCFLGFLFFAQTSMIYPGARNVVDPAPPKVRGIEVMRLSTAAGRVEALFLPATATTDGGPQPVMIFGHGNGEVTDYWVAALDGFRERGIGVLLVEYPGYGRSTGAPSEVSIRTAMDAAYDRIAGDARVDGARIVGFGQSLGGGAICLLARDRPLRALILESTFPSLDIFATGYWAPPFLLRDHFDNFTTLQHFTGPVLVIHGHEDRLIPWEQGQRLAAAAAHSTFKLYECGHGCWDPDHLPFWRDADPFLVSAGIIRRRGN
jgi:pimeloyl-ACP methyl ester carboxylesterase